MRRSDTVAVGLIKLKSRHNPSGDGGLAEPEYARNYFLPALFAAQKAFNLADIFALSAGLIVFFFGVTAGLTAVAGLARRRFSHRAF